MKKIQKYTEYIRENNELIGFNSFLIMLKVLDDIDIQFNKSSSFLNTQNYNLIVLTDYINKETLLHRLEFRSSLKLTYDIIRDKTKFSLYLGIKNKNLEFGILSENEYIKLFEISINKNVINNIIKYKCLENIKNLITLENINNLFIINNVKLDIEKSFFTDKKREIKITNFNLLKAQFNVKDFQYSNYKNILDKFSSNKKWNNFIDCYFEIDEEKLIFYFKIKRIENI